MIALVRPGAWDFPLFVHVLGAIVLFGGVGSVALLAFAALRYDAQAALLRRAAFMTTLLVVWPSYVVMRVGAQWILTREGLDQNPPGWVGWGFAVSDGGIVVLALITLLGRLSMSPRRPQAGKFLAGLTVLYVIALGLAWFAMSAKPGA
jgi:hypothetical protein